MEMYATGTGNKNTFEQSNSSLSLSKEMDRASTFAHTRAPGTYVVLSCICKSVFFAWNYFYFCIKSTARVHHFPHRYLH